MSRSDVDRTLAGRAVDGLAEVPSDAPLTTRAGLLLRPEAVDLLDAAGLGDLAALAGAEVGDLVKRGPYREVRRVQVPGGPVIFLKRYRPPPTWQVWWRKGLWQDRRGALREWTNLWRLRALGVDSMEPLAYGEGRTAGGPAAILVTRGLPTERRLEDEALFAFAPPAGRAAARRKRALTRRLAEIVRSLHDRGWYHRDLYTGHVLVDVEDDDRLYLIDVQRMGRTPRPWRLRARELSQLEYTAFPPSVGAADRMRFYRAYTGHRLTAYDRYRLGWIRRRVGRVRRHQARKRHRRTLREGRPHGLYLDRLAVRLEWTLAAETPPAVLDPRPAESVDVRVSEGHLEGPEGLRVPLGAPPGALAEATLAGQVERAATGRVLRLGLLPGGPLGVGALYEWARGAGALEF